ncbi:MAG: ATP-grasp domain-containing protein [Trebonia sp.]
MRQAIIVMHGLNTRYPGFLEAAEARGIAVLGTTPDLDRPRIRLLLQQWEKEPGSPLRTLAELAAIPATAIDPLVDKVAQWNREYAIIGAFSLTEEYVEAAALVAEVFGLQGTGHTAAVLSRNKHLQRRALPGLSPQYTLLPAGDAQKMAAMTAATPKVCKPTNGSASVGVRLIAAGEDIAEAAASYRPDQHLLIEDRVTGAEYSVESVSLDGRRLAHCVTRKGTTDGAGGSFVELEHTVGPFGDATEEALLVAAAEQALDRICMRTGISHCEIRLTAERVPVLMEVAVRGPGGAIPTLFQLAAGRSFESILLDGLTGVPAGDRPTMKRFARQWYLPQWPGLLRDVVAPSPLPEPNWFATTLRRVPVVPPGDLDGAGIHEIFVEADRDSEIKQLDSDMARACSVITHAPTLNALDDLRDDLSGQLRLVIETEGEGPTRGADDN